MRLYDPSNIVIANYNSLTLWLEPVGAGLANALSDMNIAWLSPALANLGSVSAKAAKYGFNPANAVYQLLTIPITDFAMKHQTTQNWGTWYA